jgi:hypothetical protein
MATRLIYGSYVIGTTFVVGTSKTTYQPKSPVVNSFWNITNNVDRSTAVVFLMLSPFLVPVFGISLTVLKGYEYSYYKFSERC